MRILLVTDRWDEHGGGRERYAAEIVDTLSRLGCQFDVFCRRTGGKIRARPGFAIRVFNGPFASATWRMRRAVAARRSVRPADPVLALWPLPEATHYQLHAGLYRQAYEAEADSYDSSLRRRLHPLGMALNVRRRQTLALERRALAAGSGTRLMTFSAGTARDVVRLFAPGSDRIVTEPIGVDERRFRPPAAEERSLARRDSSRVRLRLLFVGHNFELKGLRQIIAAVGILARRTFRVDLIVAGRGRTGPMRRAARHAGVDEAVRFLGSVPQEMLADLYRSSDVLVHPSFYDPFPRSVIEAMACGCPVVTSARCGAAEIVTHGREGLIVEDPRDVKALAAAIDTLADDDRRGRMGEQAAATARPLRFGDHAERVRAWLATPASAEEPSR